MPAIALAPGGAAVTITVTAEPGPSGSGYHPEPRLRRAILPGLAAITARVFRHRDRGRGLRGARWQATQAHTAALTRKRVQAR